MGNLDFNSIILALITIVPNVVIALGGWWKIRQAMEENARKAATEAEMRNNSVQAAAEERLWVQVIEQNDRLNDRILRLEAELEAKTRLVNNATKDLMRAEAALQDATERLEELLSSRDAQEKTLQKTIAELRDLKQEHYTALRTISNLRKRLGENGHDAT